MTNDNFYALVESRLPRDLNQIAIETPDGLLYSWRDLHCGSARIAGWLAGLNPAAQAGGQADANAARAATGQTTVGEPGGGAQRMPPRLAMLVEKSPEAVMLYLGALRAGWACVPLNTAYQRAELEHFLGDSRPAVVVCAPARVGEVRTLAAQAGCRHVHTLGEQRDGTVLDAASPHPDAFATVLRRAGDLAAILYTSGTTGRSKGAMLSHGNLASNAVVLDDFWGFREEREAGGNDVLLHALPLFHVHGLFVATHAALLSGSLMIFLPRFDARQVMRYLPRSTVFMGVPTYYTRLLAEHRFDRHTCRNMRLFVCGSAPLLAETFDQFRRRTGQTIVERYGMSETLMLVSNPYFGTARDRIAGTVGVPLPGVSVRVTRDDGSLCRSGEIGNVEVRGPNVFTGYWGMPGRAAQDFTADGYFRTGDVGHFGGPGRPDAYLTLVGRSRDLIISGGYNVYPKEIEGYIDAMPGVLESAVIGLAHPDFGEAVAAVVVPAPGQAVDAARIIESLKTQIAGYKVPKRLWVVAELPRNAMGKVQKNLLRERYGGAFVVAG
jgi:malonyl-CoA/methylmalonyl-CoA synthetase